MLSFYDIRSLAGVKFYRRVTVPFVLGLNVAITLVGAIKQGRDLALIPDGYVNAVISGIALFK